MDDSPHGYEVLIKIVNSGYVTEYPSIQAALKDTSNKDLILSKMALITTTKKDGSLKHRLILACRVSGTNSATKKWERILLPKITDVLADTMLLKALRQGEATSLPTSSATSRTLSSRCR